MLGDMSDIEFGMWRAHLALGSLDEDATDHRFAVLTAAAMNGPHFVKADKKAYVPMDFLPKLQADKARRDAEVSRDIRTFFLNRGK